MVRDTAKVAINH